jgi:Holliday junction DNA helicase RuvA
MIRSVRGTLAAVGADGAVVDVGGVGLLVHVSAQTLGRLPAVGGRVDLETHLVVREDALELFGFATAAERELFVAFIGVSGVGPRLASAICGLSDPEALRETIQLGDPKPLQRAPGVGKRTAERLVVELHDRLGPVTERARPIRGRLPESGPVAEAQEGLLALGFSAEEVGWGLADAPEGISSGELVRHALGRLRRG